MTNLKKLLMKAALTTSLVALVAGCAPGATSSSQSTRISGVPVSVITAANGFIATTISKDNEFSLCYTGSPSTGNAVKAASIIQSEINDGDNEEIELTGEYNGGIFEFDYVKANGIEVKF